MANMTNTRNDPRKSWIEPEVADLELQETAATPGRGGDGSLFPDCTRS